MTHLVFDFDGTIVSCETIDVLAGIALHNHAHADAIQAQIAGITALGMEGKLPFRESLEQRLALVSLTKTHVAEVIKAVKPKISPSFVALASTWHERQDHVHVISNGFQEVIEAVLAPLGILPQQIHASRFEYDDQNNVIGVEESMLLEPAGKGKMLASLDLGSDVIVVGDGYTDWQMKEAGGAQTYVAYTEHVRREPSIEKADQVCSDFDCVLALVE